MEKQVISVIGLIITLLTVLATPNILPISFKNSEIGLYRYYESEIKPFSYQRSINLVSHFVNDKKKANFIAKFLPIILLCIFNLVLSISSFSTKLDNKMIYKDKADIFNAIIIFLIFIIIFLFLNQNLSLSVVNFILSLRPYTLLSAFVGLLGYILLLYLMVKFTTKILNPGLKSFLKRKCEIELQDRTCDPKNDSVLKNILAFISYFLIYFIKKIIDIFEEENLIKIKEQLILFFQKVSDFIFISMIHAFYLVLEIVKYVTITTLIIILLFSSRSYTDKTIDDFRIKIDSVYQSIN